MSGFYDPIVFTILVSHFTICNSSKCRYPFCLIRAHRRPSPQTSQQPEGASRIQPSSLSITSTPSPGTSSSSYVEEDNGEKKKPKHMTNGPMDSNKRLFGCGSRGLTDLKAKMREKFWTKLLGNITFGTNRPVDK